MNKIHGPDEHWKEAILKVFSQYGRGSVSLQEIYVAMQNNPLVETHHKQPWQPGGQPRYQCWIRRYLTDLVRERKIRRVSRGKYSF